MALRLAASELSWDRVTGGTAWPDADNIDSTDHPGRLSPAIAIAAPSKSPCHQPTRRLILASHDRPPIDHWPVPPIAFLNSSKSLVQKSNRVTAGYGYG